MKKKILALIVIVVVFVTNAFFFKQADAAALLPFGGKIFGNIRHCECPVPGWMINVGPPVAGSFILYAGTTLYPNYNFFTTGTWLLGLHLNVPVGCGHYSHGYCTDQVPTRGLMTMVGTS